MDPPIGSLFESSPARLSAISSHCSPKSSTSDPTPSSRFESWSTSNHDTLPPFVAAHDNFHNLHGPHILESFIIPLFEKWKVTTMFGITLLYPSITLTAESMPVSRGSTLTAWPRSLHESAPFAQRISESAWRLINGGWAVYEFEDRGVESDITTLRQASDILVENNLQPFLDALAILLIKHDLQGVLGLRALPTDGFKGWVEVGYGPVALRFAPEEQTTDWEDEAEDCAWFFEKHYLRDDRSCRKHVALLKAPSSLKKSQSTTPRSARTQSRVQPEPEPELLTGEGYVPPAEDPKAFDATLRKFSNTMIVEDIEIMGDGTVRFHGRSAEMPQRPKSR